MPAVTLCVICEKPLDDDRRRRADAVTCSKRCRTALWRARRKARRTSGIPSGGVTRDASASAAGFEPPRPGALAADRAGERFRRQLSLHVEAEKPLTAEERAIREHMRRNPGVLHPVLAARWAEAEAERREREAAESASHEPPLKPENPFDPSSQGSLACRAIASRNTNRRYAAGPNMHVLRPGLSGPHPLDDSPECTDAPWSRGRW